MTAHAQVAVVTLAILYGVTRVLGLTLHYNDVPDPASGAEVTESSATSPSAASSTTSTDTRGRVATSGSTDTSSCTSSTNSSRSRSNSGAQRYFERNVVGYWLDKALQYWVVGMCANLQYIHLMQAAVIYVCCVAKAATLAGAATFTVRHFLLGSMPCTMLQAVVSTTSKTKDNSLTPIQRLGVFVTLLLPLIEFYHLANDNAAAAAFDAAAAAAAAAAADAAAASADAVADARTTGYVSRFPPGFFLALCINYGTHLLYMSTFYGAPQVMQRRRWEGFMRWSGFWGLVSRYYPSTLRVDVAPNSRGDQLLRAPDSLFVGGWHPHGVLPVTPAWFQFSEAWGQEERLKNVRLALCSSTINHLVPHMRDMVQWTGGIEVGVCRCPQDKSWQ
jgi:hypothetical protein